MIPKITKIEPLLPNLTQRFRDAMKSFHPPTLCWDGESSRGDSGALIPSKGKVDVSSEAFDEHEVVAFALEAFFFVRDLVS